MKRPLMILAVLVMATLTIPAQSDRDDRRTISVTGEAKAFVEPDRAQVVIGVETDGKTVSDAKKKNDERVSELMKALEDIGIKDADIQTSNLNIHPIYDYKSDDRRLIKYTMRNEVRITVKDLDNVEPVVNRGLSNAGNLLSELTFYREDSDKIEDSLRIEAAKDAKLKAAALAEALGVSVGKPVSISASSFSRTPQMAYKSHMDGIAEISRGAQMPSSTEIEHGQIRITASVYITFELE